MIESVPLSTTTLRRAIIGGLKATNAAHPNSIKPQYMGSTAKRIAGQIMADTKDPRVDANARHEADIREIRRLRVESYLLRRQLHDMGLACPSERHLCR